MQKELYAVTSAQATALEREPRNSNLVPVGDPTCPTKSTSHSMVGSLRLDLRLCPFISLL